MEGGLLVCMVIVIGNKERPFGRVCVCCALTGKERTGKL